MRVGERIKQRREELNFTLEEVAKYCGYKSRSSISKIEHSRALPLRRIFLISEILQMDPNELITLQAEEIKETIIKNQKAKHKTTFTRVDLNEYQWEDDIF